MTVITRSATTAARMREAIHLGTYPVGTFLPSVRVLSRQWDVAINTAVAAYRQLEREGLITAVPRSGYRVAAPVTGEGPRTPTPLNLPTSVTLSDLILTAWQNRNLPGTTILSAAIPRADLLPLAAVERHLAAATRAEPTALHHYDTVPGRPELRQAVARRLALAGANVDPEDVLITNGAQEALHLALTAVCPPGAVVAVESPAYYGLLQAIGARGLTCIEIPSSSTDGISVEALEMALDEQPIAAVLCTATFSNPGGGSLPRARQQALVDLCSRRGIPLIDDDTYGELSHDGSRPPICLAQDRKGTVLHVGSFSKCIAPGLRLGFLVAPRWRNAVRVGKFTTNISTPIHPQWAVAALLDSGDFDRHRLRTAPRLGSAMERCHQAILNAFPAGTRVSRPAGGIVLWVEMPEAVEAHRLYEDALRAGVSIAPGTMFTARKRFTHHIRLTGGWWDATIEDAIQRVGRLARHLTRTT